MDPRGNSKHFAQTTSIIMYNRQSRPLENICRYKSVMGLVTNNEAILYKVFLSIFFDKALTWFTSLKPRTINGWSTLEKQFLDKFSTIGDHSKTRGGLANIKQREGESLLSYLNRFKRTVYE